MRISHHRQSPHASIISKSPISLTGYLLPCGDVGCVLRDSDGGGGYDRRTFGKTTVSMGRYPAYAEYEEYDAEVIRYAHL